MPSTFEVGQRLVELCQQNKNMQAVDELYANDIVSVETHGTPEMPAVMNGIEAIRNKTRWWFDNHTIHDVQVEGPWPHDDRFIVTMAIDVTAKSGPMAGQRMKFKEAGLYTVKNGKVIREEFFYHMPG